MHSSCHSERYFSVIHLHSDHRSIGRWLVYKMLSPCTWHVHAADLLLRCIAPIPIFLASSTGNRTKRRGHCIHVPHAKYDQRTSILLTYAWTFELIACFEYRVTKSHVTRSLIVLASDKQYQGPISPSLFYCKHHKLEYRWSCHRSETISSWVGGGSACQQLH